MGSRADIHRLLLIAISVFPLCAANAEALTWFSRANCGVAFPWAPTTGLFADESVSWTSPFGTEVPLMTWSHHNLNGYALDDQSNWLGYHYESSVAPPDWFEWTWRSYAGHPKTSVTPFTWVHGEHHLWIGFNGYAFLGFTLATDCNITEW